MRRLVAIALALLALATPAYAIQKVVVKITDTERKETQAKIEQQLSKSYALLIGISEFDNPVWPSLGGIEKEIGDMWALFEGKGFRIAPESQTSGKLSLAKLQDKIGDFIAAHRGHADHRLVIYIATHGFADPAVFGADGYLIASDSGVPNKGV